jgi:hypothetical protein
MVGETVTDGVTEGTVGETDGVAVALGEIDGVMQMQE